MEATAWAIDGTVNWANREEGRVARSGTCGLSATGAGATAAALVEAAGLVALADTGAAAPLAAVAGALVQTQLRGVTVDSSEELSFKDAPAVIFEGSDPFQDGLEDGRDAAYDLWDDMGGELDIVLYYVTKSATQLCYKEAHTSTTKLLFIFYR